MAESETLDFKAEQYPFAKASDEGDNHAVELAVASTAEAIVTQNVRDFRGGDLRFPQLEILTAAQFLTRLR